ncbi:MAG: biopolymer transporter ExbD [Gammaproteobacteria bacterium]|nr:biopolymer transporter ExbD [Gammaproteobacteria bacterium]
MALRLRQSKLRQSKMEMSTHGIDLAPMLDFCLNLLIFFLITAVFVHTSGLLLNRQQNAQQQKQVNTKTIVVQIRNSGKVVMQDRIIDLGAVQANITHLHAVNPDAGVLIVAQKSAPTGVVVQVANQARLAGIYNITFATNQ